MSFSLKAISLKLQSTNTIGLSYWLGWIWTRLFTGNSNSAEILYI